jgi:hypothetical protein
LFGTLQSVYLYSAKASYEQIKPQLKGGQRTQGYARKYIASYLLGCPIGLDVKLEEIKDRECTAVAICHKGLIDKYISYHLKIKSAPARKVEMNNSAYMKGYIRGLKSELQKTIRR